MQMTTATIESILTIFNKEYGIDLSKVHRKKIIYNGKTKHKKSIVIISPSSKIHDPDHGWVDFTKIQIDILKQHQIAIAIFRLSNGAKYFIDMATLYPILTQKIMMTNKREGDHWKLNIWRDRIVVRNGEKILQTKLNERSFISQLLNT